MRARQTLISIAMLAACAGTVAPPEPETTGLGITRFEVRETAHTSTVIGLDADGREVARADLFHGRFTLSEKFAEGSAPAEVVGRKLDVRVLDQSMSWETEGFFPTMNLPAHPHGLAALSAFLEDSHVKPLLLRWGMAFQAADAGDPERFILNGTHPCKCAGSVCPTVVGTRPGTCGGLSLPYAFIVHQRAAEGYLFSSLYKDPASSVKYDQSVISMCCPYVSETAPAIFARRICPDTPTRPTMSTCGMVTNPCLVCPTYTSRKVGCQVRVEAAGWSDPDAPLLSPSVVGYPLYCGEATPRTADEQRAVYNVYAGWFCGDGTCEASTESCASCPADCGCTGFETCGGGGTADQCGCTPATSCPDGFQCGFVDDGCGGTVDCSGGQTCEQIVGKKHWQCVAESHLCCKHGRCSDEDEDDDH